MHHLYLSCTRWRPGAIGGIPRWSKWFVWSRPQRWQHDTAGDLTANNYISRSHICIISLWRRPHDKACPIVTKIITDQLCCHYNRVKNHRQLHSKHSMNCGNHHASTTNHLINHHELPRINHHYFTSSDHDWRLWTIMNQLSAHDFAWKWDLQPPCRFGDMSGAQQPWPSSMKLCLGESATQSERLRVCSEKTWEIHYSMLVNAVSDGYTAAILGTRKYIFYQWWNQLKNGMMINIHYMKDGQKMVRGC